MRPTSPRPRLSQPSPRATFRPAVSSTAGSQVSDMTMSGPPACRGGQVLVGRGVADRHVAPVGVCVAVVVHVTGRDARGAGLRDDPRCGGGGAPPARPPPPPPRPPPP